MNRLRIQVVIFAAVVTLAAVLIDRLAAQNGPPPAGLRFGQPATGVSLRYSSASAAAQSAHLTPIAIDYPEDGSIFPPDMTSPAFLWRDAAESATTWRIDVAFADGSVGIQVSAPGERLRIGEIDRRCVAQTNDLPTLTPREAASRSWTPDAATWAAIQGTFR